jgi:hypothetical protein
LATGFLVNSSRISAMIGTGEIVTAMASGRMLPMTPFTGVSQDEHQD